ncbi:MAG: ABC transporter ATP-binding protein [Helicobacter sp.]|nr:ABC transporter ATP-binding protein [Helicobacter sp.]
MEVLRLSEIGANAGWNRIFSNVNLSVESGGRVGILGENGVGKSTLLEIIGGLRVAECGEIAVFGRTMASLGDFKAIRRNIGFLFQNSDDGFICPSALEDVAFSLLTQGVDKEMAKAESAAILEKFGIPHLAHKSVFNLSGGEKRLVSLAGVLISKPKLLLLDEPTAALSPSARDKILSILDANSATQIIISHDKGELEVLGAKVHCLKSGGLAEW